MAGRASQRADPRAVGNVASETVQGVSALTGSGGVSILAGASSNATCALRDPNDARM